MRPLSIIGLPEIPASFVRIYNHPLRAFGEIPPAIRHGFLILAFLIVALVNASAVTEVAYPAAAFATGTNQTGPGIINVTLAPYNCVSGTDCTAGLQQAISDACNRGTFDSPTIVYIPNGTYIIHSTLTNTTSPGVWSSEGMTLQGQSQAGTMIQLATGTFTSTGTTQAMIQTGSKAYTGQPAPGQGNESFRHYIRNLTINIGTGNPGAVGIDLLVNNRGGLYNVTVESLDTANQGQVGIEMDRSWPGPGILKNVTVTGFVDGITERNHGEYGMTLDNITLNGQTQDGMIVGNTMTIGNLTSSNTVPVINTTGHVTLVGGTFTGGSSANTAITGSGSFYGRDVTSTGYGYVYKVGGDNIVGGAAPVTVPEYIEGPGITNSTAYPNPANGAIRLPIQETPDFSDTNVTTDWTNAAPTSGLTDYKASIQTAIDSGKPVVYLPQGVYPISDTVVLEGSVQKFVGLYAHITRGTGFPAGHPIIQFNSTTAAYTDIQGLVLDGPVLQNSTQTLVMENSNIGGYSNSITGTGDVFCEDLEPGSVYSGTVELSDGAMHIDYPQNIWARQLDIEGLQTNFITNDGGNVWILGYKSESSGAGVGSLFDNEDGGWAELLGTFCYVYGTVPTTSMLINNHSYMSANFKIDPGSNLHYTEDITETGNAGAASDSFKMPGGGEDCTLYSGSPLTYYLAFNSGNIVDDYATGAGIGFSSTGWTAETPAAGYFDNTQHYANTAGSTATFTFTGSNVEWMGTTHNNNGEAQIYIDGVADSIVDTYAPTFNQQVVVYSKLGLKAGVQHTLEIQLLSATNPLATNTYQSVDAFLSSSSGQEVDETNPAVVLSTGTLAWTAIASPLFYAGNEHYTVATNATASFTFTGTYVQWIGDRNPNHGQANVSIDGGTAVNVDTYAAAEEPQVVLFSKGGLTNASHTITITVLHAKQAASTGYNQTVDAFIYGQ